MAPDGAVALGEIDEIVLRVHARADAPYAWWEEWCAVAAIIGQGRSARLPESAVRAARSSPG